LLDIFIVLIIAASFYKLFNWRISILAIVTLVLITNIPGSPVWLIPIITLIIALRNVIPSGKLKRIIALSNYIFVIILFITSIPFTISQIRKSMYPHLEMSLHTSRGANYFYNNTLHTIDSYGGKVAHKQLEEEAHEEITSPASQQPLIAEKNVQQKYYDSKLRISKRTRNIQKFNADAIVQTGPGIPSWKWNIIHLRWSGPVSKDQNMSIFLLSPAINKVLSILRLISFTALIIFLTLITFKIKPKGILSKLLSILKFSPTLPLFLLFCVCISNANAEYPSKELLHEFKTKLKQDVISPPANIYATAPKGAVIIKSDTLIIREEIHTFSEVAVPLPYSEKQWSPDTVLVNGKPTDKLIRGSKGSLLIVLKKGVHQVVLSGLRESVKTPNRKMALHLKLDKYRHL
jgi:hypothetical protein